MILYNSTDNKVSMIYSGTKYEIPAQSTKEVSNEVGLHWVNVIHKFLIIKNEEIKTQDNTKEIPNFKEDSVEIPTKEAEVVEKVVIKKIKK